MTTPDTHYTVRSGPNEMTSIEMTCERCGNPVHSFDVTRFGDIISRRIALECPCPRERCAICLTPTELGKCWNVDCALAGQVGPTEIS